MQAILFPTDFSKRANQALNHAVDLTEKTESKLIIYHVYHRPVLKEASQKELDHALYSLELRIDLKFKKLLDHNTKLRRIKYEFVKELGVSIENIVKITEKESIDLIITATKGIKSPFGELWGTKTAKIIKSVKVPVLIFPDNTSLNTQSKIGLLCDYSREADYHTLDFLVEVAKRLGVDVDVITLNRNEKSMTTEEIAYKHLVRTQLEKVPSTFNFTFNNNVEEGVISYSKNNNIGLIAILPKSYSFIERLFHDSLTEQMAFHSHIPLLVLK